MLSHSWPKIFQTTRGTKLLMEHCTVLYALTSVMLVPSFTAANLNAQTQSLEHCSCIKKCDKIICVPHNDLKTHTHTVSLEQTTGKHLCVLLSLTTVTWASMSINQYGKNCIRSSQKGIYYDYFFILTSK